MDPEIRKALVTRARSSAERRGGDAEIDDAIVAALGLAENIERDIRRNLEAVQAANKAHRDELASLAQGLRAIQDRCPHVPGPWLYGYETRAYRECRVCGKEVP